ncbi:MAG: hypothetical protein K9W43_08660 [Candidatus Thorarchaeota archaeon]|nr:hypothetical protein [Candidatus Thorarchaeota archaeon]
MSLLGKYRKEAEKESETKVTTRSKTRKASATKETTKVTKVAHTEAIPNKERRSPIVSFSITSELRACLQAIRQANAINLSMWVEKRLREAVMTEFPTIAKEYFEE